MRLGSGPPSISSVAPARARKRPPERGMDFILAFSVASRRTLWSPTRPTALITTRLGAIRPADRLIAFTTDFDRAAAGFSPDRCDALVWAFSELMVEPMAGQGFYDLAREHAEALEARKAPGRGSSTDRPG
jgi:hypothetical protein